ncbi:MAG: hypothetical protein K2N87_18165 [Eubacterium sp.]|nr:hypothetical protein [Eubacterium sp.]
MKTEEAANHTVKMPEYGSERAAMLRFYFCCEKTGLKVEIYKKQSKIEIGVCISMAGEGLPE